MLEVLAAEAYPSQAALAGAPSMQDIAQTVWRYAETQGSGKGWQQASEEVWDADVDVDVAEIALKVLRLIFAKRYKTLFWKYQTHIQLAFPLYSHLQDPVSVVVRTRYGQFSHAVYLICPVKLTRVNQFFVFL